MCSLTIECVILLQDRQLEASRRVTKENEELRVSNAELKALNEMQEKLNAGMQYIYIYIYTVYTVYTVYIHI